MNYFLEGSLGDKKHLVFFATRLEEIKSFFEELQIPLPEYIEGEFDKETIWKFSPFTSKVRDCSILKIKKPENFMHEIAEYSRSLSGDATLYILKSNSSPIQQMIAWKMGGYQFDEFLTKKQSKIRNFLSQQPISNNIVQTIHALVDSNFFGRDLVNTPPNHKYPELLAQKIQLACEPHYSVEILQQEKLSQFGLLNAVGAGSSHSPRVVVISGKIDPELPTVVMVGKGVTFDAGGLQIKTDSGMYDMKMDMAGAATVVATLLSIAQLQEKPQVNLVGVIGLVENLLGDAAYKPLDIYTAYNGKTVEIHHTDAEGRLVLADCIAFAEERFQPKHIISIATLTGACIAGLGYQYAGIMGDDEYIIQKLLSNSSPDTYWRLPLDSFMKEKTAGKIADLKNVSPDMKAGSSMGGAFLSQFIQSTPYTHIDIAGVAYRDTPYGIYSAQATGFGSLSLSSIFGVGPFQS